MLTFVLAASFACSPEDGVDGAKGEQGIQGTDGNDGADGNDGNANVKKYRVTIAAADWSNGVHGGNGNVFNYYNIPNALTGNINISGPKYLVLAYGEPSGFSYNQTKLLPYIFGMETDYGIKFELDIARNQVTMSKTTNGWNSSGLDLADRPTSFVLDIFMIEVNDLNRVINDIDINNYNELVEYFEMN